MSDMLNTLFSSEFLGTFGIMILCALIIGAVVFIVSSYLVKLRRLEQQIQEFKTEVNARLDRFERETKEDFAKERHMINESLSGISETVMRAVLTVAGRDRK